MADQGWGAGYVTDIDYLQYYDPAQSQAFIALAALLNSFDATIARCGDDFKLLEIGSGLGINALIAAAANPGWQITGIDFNPSHVASARQLAKRANLDNVTFLELDLRSALESAALASLPQFDAITMHGVWSWVDRPVQDGIVRLLDRKLRPGGMLHVSYNVLTAWHGVLGLQRFVREAGQRLAHRSDRQVKAGFEVALALSKAGGVEVFSHPFAKKVLTDILNMPTAYVSHEFMNENWMPCLHADVAARLAEAKLQFAGSSDILSNFPSLGLTGEQLAVFERFDDPLMLELFKDVCCPRTLRHDVFVRGGSRLSSGHRDKLLAGITLALRKPEAEWSFEFDTSVGKAQMEEGRYRLILSRLREGPATVRELLDLPALPGRRDNPAELIGLLVATNHAVPLANPGSPLDQRSQGLNEAIFCSKLEADQPIETVSFAVPATGSGLNLSKLDAILVHELGAHPECSDPALLASRIARNPTPTALADVKIAVELFFNARAPLLRQLGFAV